MEQENTKGRTMNIVGSGKTGLSGGLESK